MPDLPASAAPHQRLRWLTPALLGCLAGSAWQLQQSDLWPIWIYACFMLLALMGYALAAIKNVAIGVGHKALASWLLVLFGLAAFGLTGARAVLFAQNALDPALQGRDVLVTGVVASLPQRFEQGERFEFAVESAQLAGQPVALPPKLALAWYATEQDTQPGWQAGDRWRLAVRLKAIHGQVNPHGFDYELWQWQHGVQASGYVRAGPKDPPMLWLGDSGHHPLTRARQQLRGHIFQHVSDPAAAGLIAALVVGDQGAVAAADWQLFRATGVSHLMSISGLHITMFAWMAAALVGWLWRRSARLCLRWPGPNAALLGGVLLALCYALFSGFGVPAQRTVLMLATVALLRLSGLRWPWPQTWLLTCAVVVAFDPWALLQAGFWLSFVAVGVLFASDSGAASDCKKRATGRFTSMLREQWVITLALAPLSLVLFGQVSLVGLAANALAIPWVTLLITPLAMLGALLPALWDMAAWAVLLMMAALRWLAATPGAVLSVAQAPWWAAGAAVLGGVVLVLRLPWRLRLLGWPLVLPVALWQASLPPMGQFELLAADIGQGSAVLVRTRGHALLFDAGPRYSHDSDAGQRVLLPLLRALGVRLDVLLLSHRDSDHMGGAAAVLADQPQAQWIASFAADGVPGNGAPTPWRCESGQHWRWDGVDFELLHPLPTDYAQVKKTNALSCVLRISNGQQAVLLTGDIAQAQEASLVQRQAVLAAPGRSPTSAGAAGLQADLLLAPHHGSQSSNSGVFLDAVQPRIAVVQAGYRNRFGHPASPVLVRYAERHIKVLDTPHCGAVTWQSWLPDAPQCQRQTQRRYWQHQF